MRPLTFLFDNRLITVFYTGFDYTDTKLALSLFGANILAGLALIFTVKTKDTKKVCKPYIAKIWVITDADEGSRRS